MSDHPLALTGERTLPGVAHERYWFARHVAAYRHALPHCRGQVVLDAGCGEGYGAALLAEAAAAVVGVDQAAEVIEHARAAYPSAGFHVADLVDLPLADAAVDVVVALQVAEHLHDVRAWLAETARVLRPGGTLICATPNRLTFPPGNPFHTVEYSAAEIADVLGRLLRVRTVEGVHHAAHLAGSEQALGRSVVDAQIAAPPQHWAPWVHDAVAAVTPDDFAIHGDDLDQSLDLVVVATRR